MLIHRVRIEWMCALASCAMLAACDATDDASDASSPAEVDAQMQQDASNGADPLSTAVGAFTIELVEQETSTAGVVTPPSTSIAGVVRDAMAPSNLRWDLLQEESGCQLLKPRVPFCDPACASGNTCFEDDTCVAPPRAFDVGTVTISGLHTDESATELSIEPLPRSNLYQPRGSSDLAYPPFDEADTVVVSAAGGELAPFELTAAAIAPIEVLSQSPLTLDPEAPPVLRWTPPANDIGTRVLVRVDISHHGGQKGELVCAGDDDGELELPAALVQGLVDLGVAGFPSLELARESISEPSPAAPGIALTIFSSLTVELEIPGVISCTEPGMQDVCPDGQLCDERRRVCD